MFIGSVQSFSMLLVRLFRGFHLRELSFCHVSETLHFLTVNFFSLERPNMKTVLHHVATLNSELHILNCLLLNADLCFT